MLYATMLNVIEEIQFSKFIWFVYLFSEKNVEKNNLHKIGRESLTWLTFGKLKKINSRHEDNKKTLKWIIIAFVTWSIACQIWVSLFVSVFFLRFCIISNV